MNNNFRSAIFINAFTAASCSGKGYKKPALLKYPLPIISYSEVAENTFSSVTVEAGFRPCIIFFLYIRMIYIRMVYFLIVRADYNSIKIQIGGSWSLAP